MIKLGLDTESLHLWFFRTNAWIFFGFRKKLMNWALTVS